MSQFVIKFNGVDNKVNRETIVSFLDINELPFFGVIKPWGKPYCKIICSCEFEAAYVCSEFDQIKERLTALFGTKMRRVAKPIPATREEMKMLTAESSEN